MNVDDEPLTHVVDGDPVVRKEISALLETVGLLAAASANGAELLAAVDPGRAGCIVSEMRLTDMTGIELLRRLKERGAAQPVIFVTGHADVAMTVAGFKAGAVELISKPFPRQELLDAVQRALDADRKARRGIAERTDYVERVRKLTPRERNVFALLLNGLTNHTIGERLGITRKTVEIHRLRVMRKLSAKSFAELVRRRFTSATMIEGRRQPRPKSPSPAVSAAVRESRRSSRPLIHPC